MTYLKRNRREYKSSKDHIFIFSDDTLFLFYKLAFDKLDRILSSYLQDEERKESLSISADLNVRSSILIKNYALDRGITFTPVVTYNLNGDRDATIELGFKLKRFKAGIIYFYYEDLGPLQYFVSLSIKYGCKYRLIDLKKYDDSGLKLKMDEQAAQNKNAPKS